MAQMHREPTISSKLYWKMESCVATKLSRKSVSSPQATMRTKRKHARERQSYASSRRITSTRLRFDRHSKPEPVQSGHQPCKGSSLGSPGKKASGQKGFSLAGYTSSRMGLGNMLSQCAGTQRWFHVAEARMK